MIIDLHCHPALPPFNSTGTIWSYDPPKDSQRDSMINTLITSNFRQTDFSSAAKGNVKLLFFSFYPIEQGFLSHFLTNPLFKDKNELTKLGDGLLRGLIMKVLNTLSFGNPEKLLSKVVFNMKGSRFSEMTKFDHDYFSDVKGEYDFFIDAIKNGQSVDGTGKTYTIKIVKNYTELKSILNPDANFNIHPPDENIICILFTVEGMHAIGCGQFDTNDNLKDEELDDLTNPKTIAFLTKLKVRVNELKNLGGGDHCPFFVTFSHHFWNQLCGHAMSLAAMMNRIFDQNRGMGTGMTKVGEEIIKQLLSKNNGKRILIDIKHMSVAGRKWYYKFLEDNHKNDPVPVIASHMGVSGTSTMDASINNPDHFVMDDKYKESEYFNNWDINLSDEEILIIYRSNGLIGLNLDQRILSGQKMIDALNRISANEPTRSKSLVYRSIWAEPVLQNILHIVKVITDAGENAERAWQMIGIGSDFDGMINALDAYCHAEDFKVLRTLLIEKMKLRASFDPLLIGKNIEELVDGVVYKNALRFLEKNFNQ